MKVETLDENCLFETKNMQGAKNTQINPKLMHVEPK